MRERKIDLTYPIEDGMTTFPVPWHPFVEVTQMGRLGIEGRETRKIVLGTHTGTHCDAPRHFVQDGICIDEIPLDTLAGPATVLNFTQASSSQEITIADLEAKIGNRRPERLVLWYGWDKYWGTAQFYQGHPFLAPRAAQWLLDQGVKLLGMDTPMPDNPEHGKGSKPDSPIHKIILGGGGILVEYLCNLGALQVDEIYLIVMPMKIAHGDGAPVRCIAIEHFKGDSPAALPSS